MIATLAREQRQVDLIRLIVAKDEGKIDGVVDALKFQVNLWNSARINDIASSEFVASSTMLSVVNHAPPLSAKKRREALVEYYSAISDQDLELRFGMATLEAIDTVALANADLRRILQSSKQWKPTERARAAEISRKRVIAALTSLTQIITAFSGV